MRFAHVSHNTINFCAAKPREPQRERAKPLSIRRALNVDERHRVKLQRGREKIRGPTGYPSWAGPAKKCHATSLLPWFYASPGSELLLLPAYHHFAEFVAL